MEEVSKVKTNNLWPKVAVFGWIGIIAIIVLVRLFVKRSIELVDVIGIAVIVIVTLDLIRNWRRKK